MSVSKVSEQDYEKMQYDVYALQKAGEYMVELCDNKFRHISICPFELISII